VSDSLYSIALGTLELSLYEQMHVFNALYNNDLIERPADHPSLAVDMIVLNGDTVALDDTVKRYHPFADLENIKPTYLGMHKRLVSTDGLESYDMPMPTDSTPYKGVDSTSFILREPAYNYAKSGTTDDVIKPFNQTLKSKRKTNYGVWNSVLRVNLARFDDSAKAPDIRDITIACVGECNEKYTGARDGKSLHKFLTRGLLLKAGIVCNNGFYTQYEDFIKKTTPKDCADCACTTANVENGKPGNPFQQLMSIFKKKEEAKQVAPLPEIQGAGEVTRDQD
jgi:hypothetical protein